jgi:hypothetical protein
MLCHEKSGNPGTPPRQGIAENVLSFAINNRLMIYRIELSATPPVGRSFYHSYLRPPSLADLLKAIFPILKRCRVPRTAARSAPPRQRLGHFLASCIVLAAFY